MAPGETTSIRLDDDDRELIARVQEETGITSITAVFRFLLRKHVKNLTEDRGAAKPVRKKRK